MSLEFEPFQYHFTVGDICYVIIRDVVEKCYLLESTKDDYLLYPIGSYGLVDAPHAHYVLYESKSESEAALKSRLLKRQLSSITKNEASLYISLYERLYKYIDISEELYEEMCEIIAKKENNEN